MTYKEKRPTMKTKVRTQVSNDGTYNLMHIQILTPRYSGARYLEPMGQITFQSNKDLVWYGMKFVIETDNVEYIKKMLAIAQYIKQNRSGFDAQPDEIKLLIGAEEHIIFDSEFIPVSDKGLNIYRVVRAGSLYDKITAPNEIVAQKKLDKMKIDAKLEFHKKIEF
jgi:hypothetical protein